jgi:hypothetical protein
LPQVTGNIVFINGFKKYSFTFPIPNFGDILFRLLAAVLGVDFKNTKPLIITTPYPNDFCKPAA